MLPDTNTGQVQLQTKQASDKGQSKNNGIVNQLTTRKTLGKNLNGLIEFSW
jgi:hypothetical protein